MEKRNSLMSREQCNAMQLKLKWQIKKKKNGICRQNTENQSENENQTEYNACVKIKIGIERVYL